MPVYITPGRKLQFVVRAGTLLGFISGSGIPLLLSDSTLAVFLGGLLGLLGGFILGHIGFSVAEKLKIAIADNRACGRRRRFVEKYGELLAELKAEVLEVNNRNLVLTFSSERHRYAAMDSERLPAFFEDLRVCCRM